MAAGIPTKSMRLLLDRMQRAPAPPLYTLAPQDARQAYEKAADLLEVAAPPMAQVHDFNIPARDGSGLPARLSLPAGQHAGSLPVLLYFHGGGYVIGSVDTHDTLCRCLAAASGVAVVSVAYRLAPEWPFPTAVNDAWDSLGFLLNTPHGLPIDSGRLAIGGDSSGGTLAAAAAIYAREMGWSIALQLLIYPGTAAAMETDSRRRYASGYLLDQQQLDWYFDQYIRPEQRADWRFAPLLADDLEGLAPAWLGLAECDPLVDEGIAYGDALRMAGVEVNLQIYRGVVHGFAQMGRALKAARQLHQDAGRALQEALF